MKSKSFVPVLAAVLALTAVACNPAPQSASAALEAASAPASVHPELTLDGLKSLPRSKWMALFEDGLVGTQYIPSKDHPGVLTKGVGFPKIFSVAQFNDFANDIWNGKNFITGEDGKTTLKNQFVQGTGTDAVQLFDANVVIDQASKLDDGKPVILLDYSVAGVPGITAVRDEIRLVSDSTANGVRRRLYLGPTFLRPDLAGIAAPLAAIWENTPVLWFALEFNENAN